MLIETNVMMSNIFCPFATRPEAQPNGNFIHDAGEGIFFRLNPFGLNSGTDQGGVTSSPGILLRRKGFCKQSTCKLHRILILRNCILLLSATLTHHWKQLLQVGTLNLRSIHKLSGNERVPHRLFDEIQVSPKSHFELWEVGSRG